MDDFYTHVLSIARHTQSPLRVHSVGYFRRKIQATDNDFVTPALSLLWSGKGAYSCDGVAHAVTPPCATWEPAGSRLRYGPDPWWEEFFIVWAPAARSALLSHGLFHHEHLVRPLPPRAVLWPMCERLARFVRHPNVPGAADRIDALAQHLALEVSLYHAQVAHRSEAQSAAPPDTVIEALQRTIDRDPVKAPSPTVLARRAGLHPQTFARRWARTIGGTPAAYCMHARLDIARRLLIETAMPIGDIATRCGFADPLYFSRRFRHDTGETATSYRTAHRQFSIQAT